MCTREYKPKRSFKIKTTTYNEGRLKKVMNGLHDYYPEGAMDFNDFQDNMYHTVNSSDISIIKDEYLQTLLSFIDEGDNDDTFIFLYDLKVALTAIRGKPKLISENLT